MSVKPYKRLLRVLTKKWPAPASEGVFNVHGVILDYQGMQPTPISFEGFSRAIEGPDDSALQHVSVRQFYETVSGGRVRLGRVTAERFECRSSQVDIESDMAAYFQEAIQRSGNFLPRTHFMFALPVNRAAGLHGNYALWFHASNPLALVHELGHNFGLKHAEALDHPSGEWLCRGDASDRMGARSGYMLFNAPNMLALRWLPESASRMVQHSCELALRPLTQTLVDRPATCNDIPMVITIPISEGAFLYLSLRDRVEPFDSRFLGERYVRKMSIHTRHGRTRLWGLLAEGDEFRFTESEGLKSFNSITISDLRHVEEKLHFRVTIDP